MNYAKQITARLCTPKPWRRREGQITMNYADFVHHSFSEGARRMTAEGLMTLQANDGRSP
jgi:hypothetical protein